jgi:hypothetical protein
MAAMYEGYTTCHQSEEGQGGEDEEEAEAETGHAGYQRVRLGSQHAGSGAQHADSGVLVVVAG